MNHEVVRIDVAPAVIAAFGKIVTEDLILPIQVGISDFVTEVGQPNANDYAIVNLEIDPKDGTPVWEWTVLCKPRGRRGDPIEALLWAGAIVTQAQYKELEFLQLEGYYDEIDGRLMSMLGLAGEQAKYWTKRY